MPFEYSKGMRQKVAIIAAMMHRPDVLVQDEHIRPVHHGGDARDLLTPAFRVLAPAVVLVAEQPEELEQLATAGRRRFLIQMMETRDQLEVLAARETVIERGGLRHVADALLHFHRLFDDIESADERASGIGTD